MVRRHHLAGDARGPEAVTRALVALHATDPASVYLSVLARSGSSELSDVSDAMYEQRSLVRWMAMRRTLFVFARADVPMIQAAASTPVAATLRRRMIRQLERNGSEPPIRGDIGRWLAGVERRVARALSQRGSATGSQLAEDEPALRTMILARAPSDRPQRVTTALLTLMSAEGRIVRGAPTGAWTSRHHRWQPASHWWPDGFPDLDPTAAQQDLARRYLESFGPATVEDLQWWTGWNRTTTRRALANVEHEEVDLHGRPGIDLPRPDDDRFPGDPVATLLPALDPTPMGFKHRAWFIGVDPARIFDRTGNIGPTLWWDGEIIGSWEVSDGGELRTRVIADRGAGAREAIDRAAAHVHRRLLGTVVTPAIRPPDAERARRGFGARPEGRSRGLLG